MKTVKTIIAIAILVVTAYACKDGKSSEKAVVKNSDTTATPMVNAYLEIKNGLVADNNEATAKAANELVTAFSKFDRAKLTGTTHHEYMSIMENAKNHAGHISKSDIEHQRKHFEGLSTVMNELVALLGTEKTLYQDFCPMANNNQGAYWLSESKEIRNPYFGSSMLKCGSIKKQIN